jgi:hypothetical protein
MSLLAVESEILCIIEPEDISPVFIIKRYDGHSKVEQHFIIP